MIRRDNEAVLAGRGGFPGRDVVEVSVHATREVRGEERPGPLTLAHMAELVRRAELLGIADDTVIVWQRTDLEGETHRERVTGAGVRRPLEETVLAPRVGHAIALEADRRAQAWAEGYQASEDDTALRRAAQGRGEVVDDTRPRNPYLDVLTVGGDAPDKLCPACGTCPVVDGAAVHNNECPLRPVSGG